MDKIDTICVPVLEFIRKEIGGEDITWTQIAGGAIFATDEITKKTLTGESFINLIKTILDQNKTDIEPILRHYPISKLLVKCLRHIPLLTAFEKADAKLGRS